MANRWKQPEYMPTPKEIEEKCEEIQRRWSDCERRRRMLFDLADSTCAEENDFDEAEAESYDHVPSHAALLI